MHLKTRVTLGAVTVVAAMGAALVPATTALAATPTLTVTMNEPTGLNEQSGDTVTAVGTGYTAGATIALVQCSSVVPDGSGCDQTPANARIVTADANGGFTVADLVVTTGPKGNGTCGAGTQCFVAGANIANQTEAAADDFTFDRLQVSPRTNLKNGQVVNLVGGGFKPSAAAYVSECTSADPAQAANKCDLQNFATFPTDANGAFTGTYTVHTGRIGSDGSECKPAASCIVAASDNIANPTTGNLGASVIKFAALKPTATTAKSTKASVAKGEKFAVKGRVTAAGKGVNGLKVTLYKVTKSGLSKLASKTTATLKGKTGSFKFKGLTQKRTSRYEVKSAANSTYAGSASKLVKVTT